MLEVRNLCKTYKGKGKHSVTVKALDNVSCVFPKTGMIFLLGKSGSGKSTLLNMIGGLDKPDSGEIIIKGKNSKDFSASDFDSYRNTFIGFIFQEYNILNEFNIEQNISLALQLQGKKNDKAAVDAILKQVDLEGLGKRKPNTLSGGQKQRVAIARALIKSPEIIMADEPSGALDSKTGKQVFETLKKLSEEKLVIVVSHDRDFAEIFGDRIIELSDGKIISDVTKKTDAPEEISENIAKINDHTVVIKDAKKLTKKDVEVLLETLKAQDGEAIISSGEHDIKAVKEAIRIRSDNSTDSFIETLTVETEEYDGKKTKFIRSRLPFARAFKMGASGLRTKPVRLIFTILLTTAALVFFGLTSALMLFKPSFAVMQALQGTDLQSEAIQKQYRYTSYWVNDEVSTGSVEKGGGYETNEQTMFGVDEVKNLNNSNGQGLSFAGVYNYGNTYFSFNNYYVTSDFYRNEVHGFIEADTEYITKNGFSFLYGTYPVEADEIAISKYHFDYLVEASKNVTEPERVVRNYSDLAGKTFEMSVPGIGNIAFKITGVIDTGTIPEKYLELAKENSEITAVERKELLEKFQDFMKKSYYSCAYVSSKYYEDFLKDKVIIHSGDGIYSYSFNGLAFGTDAWLFNNNVTSDYWSSAFIGDIKGMENKTYLKFENGNYEKLETYVAPKDDEVYIPIYDMSFEQFYQSHYRKFEQILEAHNSFYPFESFPNDIELDNIRQAFERLRNNGSYYITKGEYWGGNYENDLALTNNFLHNFYKEGREVYEAKGLGEYYVQGYMNYNNGNEPAGFRDKLNALYNEATKENVNNVTSVLINDRGNTNYARDAIMYQVASSYTFEAGNPFASIFNTVKSSYQNKSYPRLSDEQYLEFKEAASNFGDHIYEYDIDDDEVIAKESSFYFKELNYFYKSYNGQMGVFKVIGYIAGEGNPVLSREFIKSKGICTNSYNYNTRETEYVAPSDARYNFLISKSNYTRGQINVFLSDYGSYYYQMMNSTYQSLQFMLSTVSILSQVFLYLGIGFGTFAALMLLNFISQTITAKTKDIGILRAVGARGSDLFKIFFSESGLIALICIAIAIAITIPLTMYLNNSLASTAIAIQIFDFGIINIGIMLGGALIIALIGTIIPVAIAAKKPPVESIRTL